MELSKAPFGHFVDHFDVPGTRNRAETHGRLSFGLLVATRPKNLRCTEAVARTRGVRRARARESHLCCDSAGVYNILQPDIAGRLGDRKVVELARLGADVIATGNIGCAVQIGARTALPVVHTIELFDWASGGPLPPAPATRFDIAERL